MRYRFKSKSYHDLKIVSKIIPLTIILIVLITFIMLKSFIKNTNHLLVDIAEKEVEKVTYSFITDKINHDILNQETLDNLLILNKNSNNEIMYVDFNLDKAYLVLDTVSSVLTTSLKNIENGSIDISYLDKDLSHKTNSIVLSIPIGSSLNGMYFFNLGPKVPVRINFIGSILTNLETKITDYGLNNALVEVFVYVEFHQEIITPFKIKDDTFKYKLIIASKMIQGNVPDIYGGSLEKQSNIYSKAIN